MGNTEWLAAPIVFLVSRQSVSDRRSHWLVFYVVPHANTLEWPSERLKKAVFWGAYLYFPFFISLPSESEVTQSCLTLCDPVDCSPPGSSIHGILQARILEWVAISFSRGSSWPRDQTQVSHIAGRRFNLWATREEEPLPSQIYPLLSVPSTEPMGQWHCTFFSLSCLTFIKVLAD